MRKLVYFVVLLLMPFIATGCSVGMAMSGKETKDTSVLAVGVSRDTVIARLGPPQTTVTDSDGTLVDSWDVVKGNQPSAGRAVFHGAMDVLTIGLWEAVGTPVELVAGQEKHTIYTVRYGADSKIKNMSVSEHVTQSSPSKKTDQT